MSDILRFEGRPFKTIEKHDAALLRSCRERAKAGDVIVHAGDLYSFGSDRGHEGSKVKPAEVLAQLPAQFVNIRGNHDLNNKVKSLCESMTVSLGRRYPNVVVGHYPSYDRRAVYRRRGWIQLCGHVHGKWRHCLDVDRQILNVNVGVDATRYMVVSEDEVAAYVDRLLSHKPDELYRCRTDGGRLKFYGDPKAFGGIV